ncbi:MAG: hypothetical protein D6741_12355 [Planctomycetota bacterium]|nr:MAG: hypothetical protein D6741_12355 [Planctomycetota bacterium]
MVNTSILDPHHLHACLDSVCSVLECVVIGGLNPVAILEEEGYRVDSFALSGLLEFGRLFHYQQLGDALKVYLK